MAKKNKKGEKLDLHEFLGPQYTNTKLPSAPSARDPNAPEPERRGRRNFDEIAPAGGDSGWRRGAPGGGEDQGGDQGPRRNRYDQEATPSRADEDTEWRKGRPSSSRGGDDEFRDRRSMGGERQPLPPSAADESTEWRRREPLGRSDAPSAPSGGGLNSSGLADNASEWRRREPLPLRGESAPPAPSGSMADEASEWRRKQPLRASETSLNTSAVSSIADEATEWRRKDAIRAPESPAPATPSALADNDSNWRKAQPARPSSAGDSSTPAAAAASTSAGPRASETDDWRANKPQSASESSSRNSTKAAPPAVDNVDDWRAAAKLKKISGVTNQSTSKRKQHRETIAVDSQVVTPFGKGVLVEERSADRVRIVKLQFGATAYLRPEDVIPEFPEELQTAYGKAKFIAYRFLDSMCEVELEFGGHAFLRLSEVLGANNAPNNNTGNSSKSGSGKARPESSGGNKRSNKDAPPRASGGGGGNRRYGDQERDKEREKAFAKGEGGGKEEASGSKSDKFAAFSSTNKSSSSREPAAADAGTEKEEGGGRPPRSELFAAFSRDKKAAEEPRQGPTPPPKVSREEKDKLFAVFSTGPKRGGSDRDSSSAANVPPPSFGGGSSSNAGAPAPPPRAMSQQQDRREQANLFAAFDRNRDSNNANPRFSRGGDDQQQGGRGGAYPAFGGNRRDSSQGPPRVGSANSNESGSYQGGMERFGSSRPPRVSDVSSASDMVPRVSSASPMPQQPQHESDAATAAPVIPKALPKGSKWGDEDDGDDEAVAPVPSKGSSSKKQEVRAADKKVYTMEMALGMMRKSIKEYMIGEDRATAVSGLANLAVDDEQELQAVIVASLAVEAYAGTKTRKLVAGLLIDLVAKSIVSAAALGEGLSRAVETAAGDATKTTVLKELFSAVGEKTPALAEVKLREAGAKALRGEGQVAAGDASNNVDALAKEVYASGSVDKLKELNFSKLPGAGLALLNVVLKDAKLDDASCAWVTKNAKILNACLYSAPAKEQLKALEAIQVAFNGVGFPKTNAGYTFEKVFTQLFNLDVFPDTAFIAWKDDLTLSAPGRDKAIIQTTNFFTSLEEEEYEEEDDE